MKIRMRCLSVQWTRRASMRLLSSFRLKEDTIWASAGHEVAFGQYVYEIKEEKIPSSAPLKVISSKHNIGVRGAHFEVMFSVLNGGLVSYRYGGREMIREIPKPEFLARARR